MESTAALTRISLISGYLLQLGSLEGLPGLVHQAGVGRRLVGLVDLLQCLDVRFLAGEIGGGAAGLAALQIDDDQHDRDRSGEQERPCALQEAADRGRGEEGWQWHHGIPLNVCRVRGWLAAITAEQSVITAAAMRRPSTFTPSLPAAD